MHLATFAGVVEQLWVCPVFPRWQFLITITLAMTITITIAVTITITI